MRRFANGFNEFRRRLSAACCLAAVLLLSSWSSADPPQPGVIVLNDGRVYTGVLMEVAGGYRVLAAGQDVVIPFVDLRVTAASLREAYEKLRDNTPEHTVETRLRLAQWCLQNKLSQEAHDEVVEALKLDPRRTEARELFQRIEAQYFPDRQIVPVQNSPVGRRGLFEKSAATSSTGLTGATMDDYVSRVQPLLMNKCGNVKCHGQGGDNVFKLVNTRFNSSNHRLATEANLRTLFRYIDFDDAPASPLLARVVEPAEHHRQLFAKEQDREQLKLFQELVSAIAREREAPADSLVWRKPQPGPAPALQPPPAPPVAQEAIRPARGERPGFDAPAPAPETQQLLERVRFEMQPDAFDPDEFNRRVHGRAAGK